MQESAKGQRQVWQTDIGHHISQVELVDGPHPAKGLDLLLLVFGVNFGSTMT